MTGRTNRPAQRLMLLCIVVLAWGCLPRSAAPKQRALVRGPGLPPTTLVAPFVPWGGSTPVPAAGLLEDGEHAHGPAARTQANGVEELAPPTVTKVRTDWRGRLIVDFNRSVCPEDEDPASVLTLTPPTDGKAFWDASNRLMFEPDQPWPTATEIRVQVAAKLCSTASLAKAQSFETVHRPLSYAYVSAPSSLAKREGFEVSFSQRVTVSAVEAGVVVEELDGADKPLRLLPITARVADKKNKTSTDSAFVVVPKADWPRDRRLRVTIGAAMRGLGGAPMVQQRSRVLRTWGPQEISAGCSREIAQESCVEGIADARGMEVVFHNALAHAVVPGVVVSPRPKKMRMSLDGKHRLVITGDLELGHRYEVTIPAGLRDRFGQRTTSKTTLEFEIGLPLPSLELEVGERGEGAWADGASVRVDRATVGITTRRLKTVRLRVAKVPDERLDDFVDNEVAPVVKGLATLVDKTIALNPSGPTHFSSLALDLAKHIGTARGPLAITVTPGELVDPKGDAPPAQHQLVVVGNLGLTVGASREHGHEVRVATLSDGKPVKGAEIAVVLESEKGTTRQTLGKTDAAGHLHVAPQEPVPPGTSAVVVARGPSGEEAIVSVDDWTQLARKGDGLLAPNETLLGHLATERGIYRPGETIHLVAWGKIASPNEALGRRALPKGTELSFVLERDEVLARKKVKVGEQGKVVSALELDAHAKPGRYTVTLRHRASGQVVGTRSVRVEHYQVPAFLAEVAKATRDGLSRATFVVTGKHYTGESLDIVGATTSPDCRSSRPSNYDFGMDFDWDLGYRPRKSDDVVKSTSSKPTMVEPKREVTVRVDASALPTGRSVDCGVTVDLLSRTLQSQSNASSPRIQLYGVPEAVALKISGPKRKGERHVVSVRAATYVGRDQKMKRIRWPEPVDVVLVRDKRIRKKVCTLRLSDKRDAQCRLGKLEAWESYDIEIRDSRGLLARRWFYASSYVSPSKPRWAPPPPKPQRRCVKHGGIEQCQEVDLNPEFSAKKLPEELLIAPETASVLVGEKARIAIRGPWKNAPGMLVVRTPGASEAFPFTIQAGRAEVVATVKPSWEAGVELRAWVTPPPTAKTTATHHVAVRHLEVTERDRSLSVRIEAPKKASVRQREKISVVVTDPAGKPVKGRVAVWVSDRAVLDLTGYRLPRLHQLAPHPGVGDMSVHERYETLRLPFVPRKEGSYFTHGTGTGQGFGSGHGRLGRSHRARPPSVRAGHTNVEAERSNFQTTPLFVGDIATDDNGRATVELKLPDNLTEFVVLAVASADLDTPGIPERFGRSRASIVVGKSLVLTPAIPQHLRPGDEARIAAVVRNNSDKPVDVDVTAAVEGKALALAGTTKGKVTIPAGTDRRVAFEIVAKSVGTAKVRLQAVSPNATDAIALPLTVAEERLRYEEDGVQGVIVAAKEPDEEGITIPVKLKQGIAPKSVEARISFGRSPITGLEAAAASLMRFPYGCVEQLSSKLVPLIAVEELRDLGLVDENPDAYIEATVSAILDKQREDGGFGLWSPTDEAHDYGSAWATWVLVQAKRGGVKVPAKALERAITFAKKMQDDVDASSQAKALALLAIGENGGSEAFVSARLASRAEAKLPEGAFELGVLAMSLRGADAETKTRLLKALEAMLVVRGDQAGVAGPALSHGAPMGTRVPGTAAVMMGLMALKPKAPILQKLAAGLLAQRFRGRWLATQDNAFALLALSRYARLVGKPVAVQAKGWVGTSQVADARLTDEAPTARGAWTALPAGESGAPQISVQRIGSGPVHYMLRVRRMRKKGEIPKSRVLTLKRTLRTATGAVGESVTAGQVLALDVEIHASQPVSYVAIDVPLPAGLEPAIAGLRGKVDRMLGDDQRAASSHVNHQQAYPDRVVVFIDRLPPGTHRHTVYVRAVTPGAYDFPAARAMAQYAPGIQGWSTATKLKVLERAPSFGGLTSLLAPAQRGDGPQEQHDGGPIPKAGIDRRRVRAQGRLGDDEARVRGVVAKADHARCVDPGRHTQVHGA